MPEREVWADAADWLARLAEADAAQERSRERWLRQLAAEEATFAGLAIDLAERGAPVTVRCRSGRSYQGRLIVVGPDFVAVGRDDVTALVRSDAVGGVRVAPDAGSAAVADGSRRPALRQRFDHVVAGLAGERPDVAAGVDGEPELVRGRLLSVGDDVLTLGLGGAGPRQHARYHARLAAVSELVLPG